MSTFKSKNSLEDRKKESNRVLTNYPNKIPIICEKTKRNEKIPDIDKHKYLFHTVNYEYQIYNENNIIILPKFF